MTKNSNLIIYFIIAFVVLFPDKSSAQYTFTPSKTLVNYQLRNSLDYDSIHIANNSSDTLFLKWQLLLYDTTGGSYFDFCASGECYLGFPATGSFEKIKPGGFAWAGVHLWTGSNLVTSTAKIWVYKDGFYSDGDTLTYILHTVNNNTIADNKDRENSILVYPNPASDRIFVRFENNKTEEITIFLYNILGELVFKTITNNSNIEIPIDQINKGICFLKIKSGNKEYIKKVLVSK